MSDRGDPERWILDWQAGRCRDENFQRLYQRYARPVVYFFRKRGFTPEECGDLCQETFLRIYRGMKEFRRDSSFESWLFQIARNVWCNSLRNRSTQKRSGHELSLQTALDPDGKSADQAKLLSLTAGGAGPLDGVLVAERLRLIRDAMAQLSDQQQRLLLLVLQEKRYQEIADLQDMPIGTVKSQLSNARAALRRILGERYADMDVADEQKEAS